MPVLEKQLKKSTKKQSNSGPRGQKRSLDEVDSKLYQSDDENAPSDEEEGDYDPDDDDIEDDEEDEDDDDDQDSYEDDCNPTQDRSLLDSNGDSEEIEHAPKNPISLEDSKSTRKLNNSKLKSAKPTIKKSPSPSLTFGVPLSVNDTHSLVGIADTINELKRDSHDDIIHNTIVKSSEQFWFGDTPFFFCSPAGLKWIADKTGDTTLLERFRESFKIAHLAQFQLFRSSVEESAHPDPFIPEMLLTCAKVFKLHANVFSFLSHEEIDRWVANELDPNPEPGKGNGFAEKIALHSIVCLGLISFQDSPEALSSLPFKIDLALIRRQTNNAFYYFFRYSLIGNSITGVKATVLLAVCMLFSFHDSPALMILAVAVQLAQEIGLHRKNYTAAMPRLEAEKMHRLWWILYTLEKDISIMFSKPSNIAEEFISTPLPVHTPELDYGIEKDGFCYARSTAQLYLLWARICRVLYAMQSSKMSDKEKLLKLIEFDEELLQWRDSLPNAIRPGAHAEFSKVMSSLTESEYWKLRFHNTLTHTVYYFVQLTIHRQVAYHPSWIYKVPKFSDKKSSGVKTASSKTSPASDVLDSDTEHTSNSERLNALLADSKTNIVPSHNMRQVQSHRVWVERHNNVKLITKKIGLENPRFLRSFQIAVECSRETILGIYYNENSVKYLSLGFFFLNAFITLLIKCLMQPNDPKTPRDLELMDLTIKWFKQLKFFTSEIMPPDKDNFLSILKETIAKYVDRNQGCEASKQKTETEENNNEVPIKTETTNTSSGDTALPKSSNFPTTESFSLSYSNMPAPTTSSDSNRLFSEATAGPDGSFVPDVAQTNDSLSNEFNPAFNNNGDASNPDTSFLPVQVPSNTSFNLPQDQSIPYYDDPLLGFDMSGDLQIFDSLYQLSSYWSNSDMAAPDGDMWGKNA